MAPIAFVRDFEFTYGVVAKVSPLIRRVVCNNPGPFTFTGTGTYIVGHGQVAVIDPGPDDDDHLAALIEAVKGETVSHIVITHTHMDHSPLARRLKQITGAPTCGFGPHGERSARRRSGEGRAKGQVMLDAGADMDFVPDRNVADGDVITGPGWSLEAVFTPGHTSNHMAFALKEENALFSGDHVMGWSTSIIAPPDGNMADYFASLKRLAKRDDRVLWPAHGPSKREPAGFVRAFITHRRMREEAIFNRIKRGDHDIGAIVARIYREVDPRLHPAAAMSVLAHMEHLVDQGRIRTSGPVQLDSHYELV